MSRVAIVGLGKMGLSHLAIANAIEGLEVVAICDSAALVGSTIAKYGKLNFIADFAKVIDLPRLDAVIIASPNRLHAPMVQDALDHNLHVFCEKPFTLSADGSAGLAETAFTKQLVTQVGYHNRFVATFAEVKRLLNLGAIGKVTHVLAEAYGPVVLKPSKATWRSSAKEGGGCLYDYAAHPLNLVNWYFGAATHCESATLKSMFSNGVEDEVYASLGFENGVSCHLSVNWSDESVRKMTTRISIWGERGRIFADRQELQLFLGSKASDVPGYDRGWTVKYTTDLTPPVSYYLRGEEYSAQLEHFATAISDRTVERRNDFGSAAQTDHSIDLIRNWSAPAGEAGLESRAGKAQPGYFQRLFAAEPTRR